MTTVQDRAEDSRTESERGEGVGTPVTHDVREAFAKPETRALADWSVLPADIYVIGAQSVGNGIGYDVQCCSIPMVTAPEVRYVRADLASRQVVTDEMVEKVKAELFKRKIVDVFSIRAALEAAFAGKR